MIALPHGLWPGGANRKKRRLPLRQRQEVQELPRRKTEPAERSRLARRRSRHDRSDRSPSGLHRPEAGTRARRRAACAGVAVSETSARSRSTRQGLVGGAWSLARCAGRLTDPDSTRDPACRTSPASAAASRRRTCGKSLVPGTRPLARRAGGIRERTPDEGAPHPARIPTTV
jgi:hypothetical protein